MQDYDPRTVKVPPEILGKMSGMLLIMPSEKLSLEDDKLLAQVHLPYP